MTPTLPTSPSGLTSLPSIAEFGRVSASERGKRDLYNDILGCIRAAVTNEHEIAVHRIVLLPPGVIPKTTSGKIQRKLTRKLWLENALEVLV